MRINELQEFRRSVRARLVWVALYCYGDEIQPPVGLDFGNKSLYVCVCSVYEESSDKT